MGKLKKQLILILMLFIIGIIGIISIPHYVQADDEENTEVIEDEDYENYSDEYQKYLSLSDEEKLNYDSIPSKYNVSLDEFNNNYNFNISDLIEDISINSLPSSYDLRSKISIRVENQNPHGTCWAFASMGALRTHLALKGYKDGEGKTLNFSELHLDYLTSNLYSEKGYKSNLHTGRGFGEVEKYFRYNDGPIYESTLPYNSTINVNDNELQRLDNMEPTFYVHEIIRFPSISKYNENGVVKYYNNGIEVTENQVNELRNKIKLHIVSNGGLFCSVRTNNDFIGNNLGAPYNTYSGKYSQYDDGSIPDENCGSHAVTIVGWDDNYDRMNFYAKNNKGEIVHPNTNGAYLILNSYGEDAFESGYQWVSYEDHAIESYINGFLNVDETPVTVKYTFNNSNAYSALKNAFNNEGTYMIANDSNLTIEVNDVTINSIESLDFSKCNLTDEDISEIFKTKFPNLRSLNLNYNKLTNIAPILKNTSLINLNIDCNAQTQLDITGISSLQNLEYINLNSNKSLKNYSEIFQLPRIKSLLLYNDGIEDITGIRNQRNLISLVLGKNKIVDVSEIQYLNKLKRLELHENNIEDISKLNISQYSEKFTLNNQEIVKTISDTTSSFAYPDIVKRAKQQNSGIYSSEGLQFSLCQENNSGNGVTITENGKTASIKIKSGLAHDSRIQLKPILESIEVTSPVSGVYKAGKTISFLAKYLDTEEIYGDVHNGNINLSNAPKLKFKIGNGIEKEADFLTASGNEIRYTYTIQAGDNGTISITNYIGKVYDINGVEYDVGKRDNTGYIVSADTSAPILQSISVITPSAGTYKAGQVIVMEATFNENIYGTENQGKVNANSTELKIKLGNGNEKNAKFDSVNGTKIIYKYTITEGDNGAISITNYAGNVFDQIGNIRELSKVDLAQNNVIADTKKPEVEIKASETSPTTANSVTYTFTFSEDVNGFTKEDITVENGTKGEFTGSGKVYTLVVTNTGDCTQKVSVPAGVCTDAAENENKASNICVIEIKKEVVQDPEKVEVLLGDINENGKIDVSDLIAILRHIAAEKNGTARQSWRLNDRKKLIADATQDGTINISDVVKLRRYIASTGDEKVGNKWPKWKVLGTITLDKN